MGGLFSSYYGDGEKPPVVSRGQIYRIKGVRRRQIKAGFEASERFEQMNGGSESLINDTAEVAATAAANAQRTINIRKANRTRRKNSPHIVYNR
jgi:hypothetical protein